MPSVAQLNIVTIWTGEPVVRLLRVLGLDGTYLKQADITSVTWIVYDLDNGGATVASGTLLPSACVYDTLQTDQIWTADTIGYNFKATLIGTYFPLTNRRYRVVFTFQTASWGNIPEPLEVNTIDPTGVT